MTAKRPSKSELAARRKRKESAARRSDVEPLRPIDLWAAAIVECYEALVRAGYDENKARWYIEERMALPDWIIVNPDHEYEDDEDED